MTKFTTEELKHKIADFKLLARHTRDCAARANRRDAAREEYERALTYDNLAEKFQKQLEEMENAG
jgi:hypothetical protein